MILYFVATIKDIQSVEDSKKNHNYRFADVYESRTIGYFLTLEDAKKCIETNKHDLHECYYNYAVIEGVEPGLYRSVESESIWYKWVDGKYQPIEKPEQLAQIVGFTIG